MATIKIKFRASSSTENEGTLFYRVTHNRIVRQISSGYKVFPQEWNAEKRMPRFTSRIRFYTTKLFGFAEGNFIR